MSQVYGFARQSGGQVRIDSRPGEGTTVDLYLPRAAFASVRREPAEVRPENLDLGGLETVLIVEDNELVRSTMETMTEGLGYRVLTAGGAAEALQLIGGGAAVDILVSDIVMPGGVSGVELADQVRALRPEIPILLMSGYPAATPDGFGGYPTLHKPFRSDELGRQIRSCLEARTAPPQTGH